MAGWQKRWTVNPETKVGLTPGRDRTKDRFSVLPSHNFKQASQSLPRLSVHRTYYPIVAHVEDSMTTF